MPRGEEISVVEGGKRSERAAILALDTTAGKLQQPVLPEPAQHSVGVWDAETYHIGELHLGDREAEDIRGPHPGRSEACGEFEQEVRHPLARASPADVDQMLTQARRLARRGAHQREGELRQGRQGDLQIRGGYEHDHRASERCDGIQRRAEEAARRPESVSGERDIEDLPPAIGQSAIT